MAEAARGLDERAAMDEDLAAEADAAEAADDAAEAADERRRLGPAAVAELSRRRASPQPCPDKPRECRGWWPARRSTSRKTRLESPGTSRGQATANELGAAFALKGRSSW